MNLLIIIIIIISSLVIFNKKRIKLLSLPFYLIKKWQIMSYDASCSFRSKVVIKMMIESTTRLFDCIPYSYHQRAV